MELLTLPVISRLNSFSISHPLLGVFVCFAYVYVVWLHLDVLLVVDHSYSNLWTLVMLHNTAHATLRHLTLTMLVGTARAFRLLWFIKDSRLCFPCREFLLLATELEMLVPSLLDRLALHLVRHVFSSLVV